MLASRERQALRFMLSKLGEPELVRLPRDGHANAPICPAIRALRRPIDAIRSP
jgi:hypothetical protein